MGASRYHIIGSLGSGGMAEVDLALQTSVGNVRRLAAVKRVRPEHARSSDFVGMFLEEARISASLSHPHVVHTYEVGRDDSGCFMAMEFLRGQSYARILDEIGFDKIDYSFALEVLLATLDGLDYAHQLRDVSGQPMALVHRDISPGNLFVSYDGQIKILDFGIAKALGSSVHTKSGVIKGKLAYMAPEQVRAEPHDARADLYAVGVMLWEVTRGARRWGDHSEIMVMSELAAKKPPESPRAEERGLPALADAICARALAPEADDRYRTAAEFRAKLLELSALVGARLSRRELGGYVSRLFVLDARREQQAIDAALARLDGTEGNIGTQKTRLVTRETTDETPGVVSDHGKTRERRGPLVLALLLASGAAIGLGAALWPRAEASDARAELAKPSAAALKTVVAEPAPAASSVSALPSAAPASTAAPARRKAPAARATSSAPPKPTGIRLDRRDPWSE